MDCDVLIVGGGTSGAALAGILARDTEASIVLLEAGPDYGGSGRGGGAAELLGAPRLLPESHGWGYSGLAHASHAAVTNYDRARVIGGCSAHNGCVALAGHRRGHEGWGGAGKAGRGRGAVGAAFFRA